MTATSQKPMTVHKFLDWENRQELKYGFDGFQPVGMTGGARPMRSFRPI